MAKKAGRKTKKEELKQNIKKDPAAVENLVADYKDDGKFNDSVGKDLPGTPYLFLSPAEGTAISLITKSGAHKMSRSGELIRLDKDDLEAVSVKRFIENGKKGLKDKNRLLPVNVKPAKDKPAKAKPVKGKRAKGKKK